MSDKWAMCGLLLATLAGMSYRVSAPWIDVHDHASAQIALIARNHTEYGLLTTRGASVSRVDRNDPANLTIYSHRPVLFPLALAAMFTMFGATETVARLFVIAIALASTWALYRLVARAADGWTGFLAALLFALAPANLFFGRTVSLTQGLVLFLILVPLLYLRWLETRSRRDYLLLAGGLVLGMATNWQAYYLAVVLPLHFWLTVRDGARAQMLGIVALVPLMFAGFLLRLLVLFPSELSDLWNVFRYRAGLMSAAEQIDYYGAAAEYTASAWVTQVAGHAVSLLGPALLALAAAAAIAQIVLVVRGQRDAELGTMPLVLLAPAVIHSLLFANTMFIHNYLMVLFLPGVAWLAALAWVWLARLYGPFHLPQWAALLLLVAVAAHALPTTLELHAMPNAVPAQVGMELAGCTQPRDEVIVLGVLFHPAVEWYADRNVYFLDSDGPIEPLLKRPGAVVAAMNWTPEWIRQMSNPESASALRTAERTGVAWDQVEQSGRVVATSENLRVYVVDHVARPSGQP